MIIPDIYLNAGGVHGQLRRVSEDLGHIRYGRMNQAARDQPYQRSSTP